MMTIALSTFSAANVLPPSKNGTSPFYIALYVFAVFVFIFLVVIAWICYFKRKRQHRADQQQMSYIADDSMPPQSAKAYDIIEPPFDNSARSQTPYEAVQTKSQ